MAIFEVVFRPPDRGNPGVRRAGRREGVGAADGWALGLALGCLAWGCRPAPTDLGPPPPGSANAPPAVKTFPSKDTTVDSIGVMNIGVLARDQTKLFTVTLELSGARSGFPPDTVNDTLFVASYPVSLGALRHQPFSFRVQAVDVLGRDTVTDSVLVRLR